MASQGNTRRIQIPQSGRNFGLTRTSKGTGVSTEPPVLQSSLECFCFLFFIFGRVGGVGGGVGAPTALGSSGPGQNLHLVPPKRIAPHSNRGMGRGTGALLTAVFVPQLTFSCAP